MTSLVLARTQTLTAATAMTKIGSTVYPPGPVTLVVTGSGGSLAGGQIAVVGLDADGAAQTENVAVTAIGTFVTSGDFSSVTSLTPSGAVFTGYSALVTFDDNDVEYNAVCDDSAETEYQTLAQLRRRLLVRLGYSAQADNPPPGMADLLTDFLQSAQRTLFKKFRERRIGRMFTWQMTVGERFYLIQNNQDTCSARLDTTRLEWVGVQDTNLTWMRMGEGINPHLYTSADRSGIPARYEIRQGIEVYPAPDKPYRLRIKGGFKLGAFTADGDATSLDSELVFLWALGNAKNHYGQPDASAIASQANDYLGRLVSGTHGTRRYIPGTTEQAPMPKPVPTFQLD